MSEHIMMCNVPNAGACFVPSCACGCHKSTEPRSVLTHSGANHSERPVPRGLGAITRLQHEPHRARDRVIDALVMTRLSDFAGTDMAIVEEAADAVLNALGFHGKAEK